jgi:GH25 family lysozyme M1 (1,4-beta-N-acetylmuramidase)
VRVQVPRWLAGACALIASLGMAALANPPAAAGTARPVQAAAGPQPNRSNVGATHSPQLLRQLAGPPGGAGAVRAAIGRSAITGAVQGVDIASHQHPGNAAINWQQVAGDGIRFAAVKATEGNYYQNPYALNDLAGAQAAGLSVIAYAFAIPNGNGGSKNPAVQADYLLSYLGAGSSVPVLLDIEYDPYVTTDHTNECYGLSPSAMRSWIAGFDSEVQAKTSRLPIIYTTGSWWQQCTGSSTAFGQTPIWAADYTTSGSPLVPAGWANWDFWQYTSAGTVTGIKPTGSVDLDQINPGLLPLLDPGAQRGAQGSPVALQLSQASPATSQAPSFSATGLPPGTSISTGGQVTGWPAAPGTYQPTVSAAVGGASGSVSFTWQVTRAAQGPAGPVRIDAGGKCLNDAGNKSASGTRADIWTCNGSTAQRWAYVQDGTLRIHGKCLAPPNSGPAKGTAVTLQTCTGAPAQQWWLTYPRSISRALGAAPIALLNPAAGLCLADPGGSKANGTTVIAGRCNGDKNQAWTPPAGPVSSRIPGLCLDDGGNAVGSGTPARVSACASTAAQRWTTEPDGTVRAGGKCLDAHGTGTASGTPVGLWPCDGTRGQQWHLVPRGGGVRLVNPRSGLCLADPGNSTAGGTRLQIRNCAAAPGQQWRDL